MVDGMSALERRDDGEEEKKVALEPMAGEKVDWVRCRPTATWLGLQTLFRLLSRKGQIGLVGTA